MTQCSASEMIPDRIAIGGANYGGYATLMALAQRPEVFRCGVDGGGPTDLLALLEDSPPHWTPLLGELAIRIGDPTVPAQRDRLRATSPIAHAAKVRAPLLVVEGRHDPRPNQAGDFVKALDERGTPVTHVVFPDEGPVIERPENRIAYGAVIDAFLAQCLSGPYEPLGRDLRATSMEVRAGVERIPSLMAALAER